MIKKPKIIIIGGGWAGAAAASRAKKAGADVLVLERTDMLLGTGLVGGIFRNNGRFTAAEELIALGDDIIKLMDKTSIHTNVEFPGHKHASLYSVFHIEPVIKKYLLDLGVEIRMKTRVTDIERDGSKITAVVAKVDGKDSEVFEGDVFIDATGSSAVPGNCKKHGNGCAMCILRCHTFGPRVELMKKAGVRHWNAEKSSGFTGAMSGSCKLQKESLDSAIVEELEKTGSVCVPVPDSVKEDASILGTKACQQYALKEFVDNLVLLDTGPVKLMTPFFPLEDIRKIPGMEHARYEDPISGGQGNSMRYFGFADCEPTMKAIGEVDNLFCAGEKAGAMVGHTEVIVTGSLAAHNAVCLAAGRELVKLPDSLAVGDLVNSTTEKMKDFEGRQYKYTFSGSVYFERMKELGLYTTDVEAIRNRVDEAGLTGLFAEKII